MKKSTKNIAGISGALLGLAVLYLAGGFVSSSMGLEYRFWVSILGKCLCLLVFPLWIAGAGIWMLWRRFREHVVGKWLVRLAGAAVTLLCLVWSCLVFLFVVFSSHEDHYLGGGLVSVVVESFPKPASYAVYESVGPFFRREISLTEERIAEYLSDRYHRDFYPVYKDGETLYVDAGREGVSTSVEYLSGRLHDGYPQALADYCLEEGYQALGLKWDFCILETGRGEAHFCLVLDDEENITAFGADVYRLMQYALEREPLLKKQEVYLYLSSREYRGQWGMEGFGSSRSWESLSTRQYPSDEAKVTQSVKWAVDSMRIQAQQDRQAIGSDIQKIGIIGARAAAMSASLAPEAAQASAPELTEREMVEAEYPEQCQAAEAIWEAGLKDAGYGYEPGANAKGNLVIWLGKLPADDLQSDTEESDYYLTYDRESKNGNCYLFVLSEVPEGYGPGDAYLREFYACEKGTLTVVAGNKTSWAQVGCAEYREITGE
ncbi:MAG: hypothetical protein NC420_06325 [Eubacterium sp.]|nr:hypothetical protein [Eubacterium sp.]MCM1214758.1 hypothetical protein [Lachnospiraceae bacterium]MCM1239577.1 hypothetical protein [Lachnospiraceae bacterium]